MNAAAQNEATFTEITNEIRNQILDAVRPQFGGFDVESCERWGTIRTEIAEWLDNGDYGDGDTVDSVAAEVREEWGELIN